MELVLERTATRSPFLKRGRCLFGIVDLVGFGECSCKERGKSRVC